MLLFTFKQQVQMQKMQAIQPEISAISNSADIISSIPTISIIDFN